MHIFPQFEFILRLGLSPKPEKPKNPRFSGQPEFQPEKSGWPISPLARGPGILISPKARGLENFQPDPALEEELHPAFFSQAVDGICRHQLFSRSERKNEEETATKTALGKFLRHCRDLTMKSLTKLLPSGGSRRRVLSHSQMK